MTKAKLDIELLLGTDGDHDCLIKALPLFTWVGHPWLTINKWMINRIKSRTETTWVKRSNQHPTMNDSFSQRKRPCFSVYEPCPHLGSSCSLHCSYHKMPSIFCFPFCEYLLRSCIMSGKGNPLESIALNGQKMLIA